MIQLLQYMKRWFVVHVSIMLGLLNITHDETCTWLGLLNITHDKTCTCQYNARLIKHYT